MANDNIGPSGQWPAVGLALSGGGLRATLFHLGVLRALREAQELRKVTHIWAVSGGSILAGHLALNWARYNGTVEEVATVEQEVKFLAQRDLRNRILRRWFATLFLWKRGALLEREYNRFFQAAVMHNLPEVPRVHILACSMTKGSLCSFTRDFLYFYPDKLHVAPRERYPIHDVPVAFAVAASSAFPPLFPPIAITSKTLHIADVEPHFVTDGGVYDNLGATVLDHLEPGVLFREVYFSDAAARAQANRKSTFGFVFSRTVRATDLLMERIAALTRNRQARTFSYWDSSNEQSTLNIQRQEALKAVRTDLDGFSPELTELLIQHGYEQARYKLSLTGKPRSYPPGASGATMDAARIGREGSRRWRRLIGWDWAVGMMLLVWIVIPTVSICSWVHAKSARQKHLQDIAPIPKPNFLAERKSAHTITPGKDSVETTTTVCCVVRRRDSPQDLSLVVGDNSQSQEKRPIKLIPIVAPRDGQQLRYISNLLTTPWLNRPLSTEVAELKKDDVVTIVGGVSGDRRVKVLSSKRTGHCGRSWASLVSPDKAIPYVDAYELFDIAPDAANPRNSGSPVVTNDGRLAAISVCAEGERTYAVPIQSVFLEKSLEIVGSHLVPGACNGSAIVSLSDGFQAGDDEINVLRRYSWPPNLLNKSVLNRFANLVQKNKKGKEKELDVEAAAREGDVVYWIGSHESGGRERLFATSLDGLHMVGKPVTNLLQSIKRAVRTVGYDGEQNDKGPEIAIEGLTVLKSGELLMGLRRPLTADGRAFFFRIKNPRELIERGRFEGDIPTMLFYLNGMGVRGLETVGDRVVVLAGLSDRILPIDRKPVDLRVGLYELMPDTANWNVLKPKPLNFPFTSDLEGDLEGLMLMSDGHLYASRDSDDVGFPPCKNRNESEWYFSILDLGHFGSTNEPAQTVH